MADQTRIQELFDKYLQQRCTPAEKEELSHLLQDLKVRDELSPQMLSLWEQIRNEQKIYPVDWEGMYEKITRHSTPNRAHHSGHKRIVYKAAAAIGTILVMSVGWYAWRHNLSRAEEPFVAIENQHKDVAPGGNKAVLTLANGSTIMLNNAANGLVAQQGSSHIVKLDSGELSYQSSGRNATQAIIQYNTLTTPRGGQYRLQLPDGTKVWLNAASSIHYPTAFTGKDRQVEITGEAYFEVADNPNKPFTVKVNGMQIKVLGTHFNVNAYMDESEIKTTLIEGSIKISYGNNDPITIKPGEQAKAQADGRIDLIKDANIEEILGWKNGLFVFYNDDLQTVMRRISRWYDIDVQYENNVVPPAHFTGAIRKEVNLSEVFKMLDLTGGAVFKIEGKKVIVVE